MNQDATLRAFLSKPLPAAVTYAIILILLLFTIVNSLSDLFSQRTEVAAAATMLEQFEGHRSTAVRGQPGAIVGPAGSPFLEGATVTVAAAALLQRVTAAVTKIGGRMLSSQVDLQGTQSATGFLSIIASCEIDQPGLQQLLYDVEAGMPFLFVEQLVVQAPVSSASSGDGKLRVLLTVSGQWKGAK